MSRIEDPVFALIVAAGEALEAVRAADGEDAPDERMEDLSCLSTEADFAVRGCTPTTLPGVLAKLRHTVRRAPNSPSVHALRDAIAWLERCQCQRCARPGRRRKAA